MASHNSLFICSHIASKRTIHDFFTNHQNIVVSYEKKTRLTHSGYGALIATPSTHIEYGCSKRDGNVNYNCPECKHAAKFKALDMLLIFFTLGVWWPIGLIVIPKPELYGITREAAQQHSKIKSKRDATFTDNMYEYEGRLLRVY